MSGRGGTEERRGDGPGRGDAPRQAPERGGPGDGRRLTYEQVVAKDMHYSRLRLATLKARYDQRQKLLAELQQDGEDMAVQAAKRVAAELAGTQQRQQPDRGPS